MKVKILRTTFVTLVASLAASGAWAMPIHWTLSGGFDDSAALSGSFDYDATTNDYTNVSISVANFVNVGAYGSLDDDPFTYVTSDHSIANSNINTLRLSRVDLTDVIDGCAANACQRQLFIVFATPLTNAGGTVNIATGGLLSYEFLSNDGFGDFDVHEITGGTVVGVIPIPAAVWLFGSGLVLLGWVRRKEA